jgi:hypothetical protein
MWIYLHVDGEVHRYFQLLEETHAELMTDKRAPADQAFEDLFEQLRDEVESLRGHLVMYADATEDVRAKARDAYLTTLDLVQLLADRVETRGDTRFEDTFYAALDFLEEWQPYLSIEDAAFNLVKLDGLDPAEALAMVERDAALPSTDLLDDDCPLCRLLSGSRT